jgi:flavin-dependent dehydrogenase
LRNPDELPKRFPVISLQNKRIAIVGAGPAGSAAAYHLAMRGHAVTLFDRAAFPRDKTCGDWLTPAALAELAALGLDRDALAQHAPGHAVVAHTMLVSPDGRASARASRMPGACVPRRMLDEAIRERALRAGCEPMQRTFRDLDPDCDAELAVFDIAIDARGATAGAPNAIGLRGYWTVPRAALAEEAARRVEIHTDAAYRRGYGWIFPVREDAASVHFNIGVGLWKGDSGAGHSVADFLDRFLAGNRVAGALCALATDRGRPVGYPVALGLWRNRVAAGSVLRIGDAANLADPLTGDGIGNALASGRLVAAAVAGAADAAEAAANWQRTYELTFAPELRRALVLRRLLLSTPAKNLATRVLERGLPRFGTRLHRAVFGESGYRDMWRAGAGQPWMPPKRS